MSSSNPIVVLKSSDGETFQVEQAAAVMSQTIKHLIDDVEGYADASIPLPNVTGKILSKVIEYCKKHAKTDDKTAEDLKAFDADFVKVDQNTLLDLCLAASYLEIKSLQDLTNQTAADMIKDYTPEQMRKVFNIKNNFTPEKEGKLRTRYAWAFE